MNSLFSTEPIVLNLPDADIIYYPSFFDTEMADSLYNELLHSIPWQQDLIKVYGKEHNQPRLTALFGNDGKPYSYSNITMQPHAWNLTLQKIKDSSLKQNILLEHGSFLLMKGCTQHCWKHQIPKTNKPIAGRINLTFRVIQ